MSSLSHEEKSSWEQTGELPSRVALTDRDGTSVSSAAPPVEQAASTDAQRPPASEPGKGPKEDRGAKTRNAELDADIAGLQERLKLRRALRDELATLERPRDAKPSASSPEQPAKVADWERFAAMPDAPKADTFATYDQYTAAMSLFVADKRFEERDHQSRVSQAQTRHEESVQKTVADAAARIEKFREVDADLESKIDPQLTEVIPASLVPKGQPIGPHHALMEEILRSDFTPQLLIHFSTPEGKAEFRSLCQLGSQSPSAFLRAFGRVEARFDTPTSSAPPAKHVSSAPAPPTVLGARTSEALDPVEAAIKSGDGKRYADLMNKREMASR